MNKSRFMGIDYGKRRVGIARSSEDDTFAFPLAVLGNGPQLLKEVLTLLQTEKIGTIVVGDSRTYAGRENPIMKRARAFIETLQKESGVEVVFENETLTSAQARRAFEVGTNTRKLTGRDIVDASAAALILQAYLDKKRSTP